jgi:hypothetical protein
VTAMSLPSLYPSYLKERSWSEMPIGFIISVEALAPVETSGEC